MDQYLLIPFLGGWTSIYQLFWCSPGVQGFDTLPYNHWHQERVSVFPIEFRPVIPQWYHNWTSNGCPHGVVSRARNHVMPKLNENAIKSWCFPWYQLNIKHHCWMVKVNGFIVFFLPPFWGDEPQWRTTHFWGVETTFICCIFSVILNPRRCDDDAHSMTIRFVFSQHVPLYIHNLEASLFIGIVMASASLRATTMPSTLRSPWN